MTIQELAQTIYDEWPHRDPTLHRGNMVKWLESLITEWLEETSSRAWKSSDPRERQEF